MVANEEGVAHALVADLTAVGVDPRVTGDRVHWHLNVGAVVHRRLNMRYLWQVRIADGRSRKPADVVACARAWPATVELNQPVPASTNQTDLSQLPLSDCATRRWPRSTRRLGKTTLVALLAAAACSKSPPPSDVLPSGGGWQEFQGIWTAAGSRQTLRFGGDRRASIANLSGSLLLTGPLRPAVGFRAEAIVLNDSATGMVGRSVWTDERGDQVFSELRGQGTATGKRVVGTFIGGSGRYTGATGSYEFSWWFVVEADDGVVQGQSTGLSGRVRINSPQAAASGGGQKP